MNLVGRWLAIQAYKHDGSLHRTWDRGLVLENNDDYIVIATKRAKVTESNGRRWFTKEPAVTIFSKKEWWNTICMLKNEGIAYYCNIASPSLIHESYIKYIDYELDAKLLENKSIRLLDEEEYCRSKRNYGYSDDLDKVLRYSLKKVNKMMKEQKFPFDDNKIKEFYNSFLELVQK